MKLEDLEIYQVSIDLGEKIWRIVMKWDSFSKDVVGKQLVKAVDSIAANIGEGFGRFHYRESKNFGYYARGSLFETKVWLKKANNRNLIDQELNTSLKKDFEKLGIKLNNYIKSIGSQLNQVEEDEIEY